MAVGERSASLSLLNVAVLSRVPISFGIKPENLIIHLCQTRLTLLDDLRFEIASAITANLTKGKNITPKKLRIHEQGLLQLPAKRLNCRCAPQWRHSKIESTVEPCTGAANKTWTMPTDWDLTTDKVSCPKCHTLKTIKGSKLRNSTGYAYMTCIRCKIIARTT